MINYQEIADNMEMKLQHPVNGEIPFILRDYQIDLLGKIDNNDRTIVVKARQLGISTVMSFYAVMYCLLNPHSTVAMVGVRHKCCEYIKEDIRGFFHNEMSSNLFTQITNSCINFTNGSEIIFCTKSIHFRGKKIDIFMFDEFAHNIQDKDIYNYVDECGSIKEIYCSTPNGTNNEFYNLWKYSSRKEKVSLDYRVLPSKIGWEEEWKKMMGLPAFKQEYECWFNPDMKAEKTEVVNIRMTEKEKQWLEYNAKVNGFKSLSEYIRFLGNRDENK